MRARLIGYALLLAMLATLAVGWRYQFDSSDTAAALAGRSAYVQCIVWRESSNNPNAVGRAGERGAVQLASFGLLPDMRAWAERTYADGDPEPEWNPYKAVVYLEAAIDRGLAHHWSAARYC